MAMNKIARIGFILLAICLAITLDGPGHEAPGMTVEVTRYSISIMNRELFSFSIMSEEPAHTKIENGRGENAGADGRGPERDHPGMSKN